VLLARDALGEWPKGTMAGFGPDPEDDDADDEAGHYTADGRMLTNIVMMGMGEPLYNFDEVKRCAQDRDGRRRAGAVQAPHHPLHQRRGPDDGARRRRDRRQPRGLASRGLRRKSATRSCRFNRKYGIEELLQACADYPGANNARRITFEYVMLKDKNDSDDDARELVRLIKQYKLPAKVNLIPFNPWPGAPYECSTPERVRAFSSLDLRCRHLGAGTHPARARHRWPRAGSSRARRTKPSRAELDRFAEEKQAALG
jgi:23S rRNA (adenine2503-C2)-methyltransferase